jgi:hypothetical protein
LAQEKALKHLMKFLKVLYKEYGHYFVDIWQYLLLILILIIAFVFII